MLPRLATLIVACSLCACVAAPEAESDPDLDSGKADGGLTPVLKGTLPVTAEQDVAFADATGAPIELFYFEFELSGAATVTVGADDSIATTVYFYHPHDGIWGRSVARAAQSLTYNFAAAGTYRALVKRKTTTDTPHVTVTANCSGTGCALPQIGCTPTSTRVAPPEVFVGPQSWQTSIEAAIDSAAGTLDVQMYLFTVADIAQHIIAAQQRGVAVRVLLDPHEDNSAVVKMLNDAGVPNKTVSTVFSYAHAKYLVIDGRSSVVLSGNFNAAAVDTVTTKGERNYGFVDHDPDDAARIESVFESDWTTTSGAEPDLGCTRMAVSPVNSKQRILDHVASAQHTLEFEVLYLEDADVKAAILDRAAHGVAVRVLLSDPARNSQNTTAIAFFKANNIPVRALLTNYLHAKMIVADGVVHIGSENMSETSLTKNREMGGLVFEPDSAAVAHTQFETDWANGQVE